MYRKGWRTLPNILYEIDVLIYLASNGIPVSKPLPQNDGRIIQTIRAPEGNRHIVLFTYAKGRDPSYETKTDNNAYNYGKAVAKIHKTVQNFTSEHLRFELNLEYLLYTPLKSIKPMLSQREKDWSYLSKLVERIYRQFERLQIKELEQGFCHGDFHGGNAHFSDDGAITFFDFDCCGWGFRAYDIAVFRWGARLKEKGKKLWEPFLQGYTQERNLKKLILRQYRHLFVFAIFGFWVYIQAMDTILALVGWTIHILIKL